MQEDVEGMVWLRKRKKLNNVLHKPPSASCQALVWWHFFSFIFLQITPKKEKPLWGGLSLCINWCTSNSNSEATQTYTKEAAHQSSGSSTLCKIIIFQHLMTLIGDEAPSPIGYENPLSFRSIYLFSYVLNTYM